MGITDQHATALRGALLAAAVNGEAVPGERDEYGQRYSVDFDMTGPTGTGRVRSAWIVLAGDDFPRLTSCYVL